MNGARKFIWQLIIGALALGVAASALVTGARELGLIQAWELLSYDTTMQWRHESLKSDQPSRVVIVAFEDQDLERFGFPVSDRVFARLLQTLVAESPAAIGIDIYRDLPQPPGTEEFHAILLQNKNIYAAMTYGEDGSGTPPPKVLEGTEQVGFADGPLDDDRAVRRVLLTMDDGSRLFFSLPLRLALHYLRERGVLPEAEGADLRLGNTVFRPLERGDGPYVDADTGGYQIMRDFAGRGSFPSLTVTDVLEGSFELGYFTDKVVIIGTKSKKVRDDWRTPVKFQEYGVVLHAHAVEQIIDAAIDGDRTVRFLRGWQENTLIALSGILAGLIALTSRGVLAFIAVIATGVLLVPLLGYVSISHGLWIPMIPPLFAWILASAFVVTYLYSRERHGLGFRPDVLYRKANFHRRPTPPVNAEFAVFAPTEIAIDSTFILDVWAYQPQQYAKVLEMAKQVCREFNVGQTSGVPVPLGDILTVKIDVDGLKVPDPVGTFVWSGTASNASFVVRVPPQANVGQYDGKAIIGCGGLPIAKVVFVLSVSSKTTLENRDQSRDSMHLRSAFASYASDDREQVLAEKIQGMKKVAPELDIFVDVYSLRSGARWQENLELHVPSKDAFFLFWSLAASKSEWVDKEWRLALSRRGLSYIDPVPLEEPSSVPPPTELSSLHFADSYLSYIEYERLKRQQPIRVEGLVFISARSEDYGVARQIYRYLEAQGVEAFFSEDSLMKAGNSDFRKEIDLCLERADHMILVGSSVQNIESPWAQAEWGAFVNEQRSGRAKGNLITVVIGDLDPARLPIALRQSQVVVFHPERLGSLFSFLTP